MNRKGDVIGVVSAGLLLVVSMSFASDGGVIGPMSARSAEGRVVLGGGPKLPVWNAGASFPAGAGVVRYAWTQCPTMPDSVFIISGVDESFTVTTNSWPGKMVLWGVNLFSLRKSARIIWCFLAMIKGVSPSFTV